MGDAVASILAQTLSELELLVVDDASTDGTPDILSRFARDDARVRVLTNSEHLGLAASLNLALPHARASYVARQDGDDVSLPGRMEKQAGFLDQHRSVGVVGSWATGIDERGERIGPVRYRSPSNQMLKWGLLFRNRFIHPSVMFRKDTVLSVGGYDTTWLTSQDYDLWSRLVPHTEFANIPEVLLLYRIHCGQVGVMNSELQRNNSHTISQRNMESLGVSLDTEVEASVRAVFGNPPGGTSLDVVRAVGVLPRILCCYCRHHDIPISQVREIGTWVAAQLLRGRRNMRRAITQAPVDGFREALALSGVMLQPRCVKLMVRRAFRQGVDK